MFHDGSQKKGRFFKKGSRAFQKIEVSEFNFDEINQTAGVLTDNPKNSVIINHLHDTEELQAGVKNPTSFQLSLAEPGSLPIIKPTDFTSDWEKERKKAKQKSRNIFDEEEDDLDFGETSEQEKIEVPDSQEPHTSSDKSPQQEQTEKPHANYQQSPPQSSSSDPIDEIPTQGLATIEGSELNAPSTNEQHSNANSVDPIVHTPHPKMADNRRIEEEAAEGPEQVQEPTTNPSLPESPVSGQPNNLHDPLLEQAREIRMPEVFEKSAEELEAIEAEANARGFEKGFLEGEEKAIVQTREKISEIMSHIDTVVEELAELKPAILQSAQHNFLEISKALCESILGKAVELNPEVMGNIIERAIRETLNEDKFSIRVHHQIYDALKDLDSFPHKTSLVSDEGIKMPEEFHIESDITHVDGNIRKIVDEMLEEADLNLFEPEDEQASTEDDKTDDEAS